MLLSECEGSTSKQLPRLGVSSDSIPGRTLPSHAFASGLTQDKAFASAAICWVQQMAFQAPVKRSDMRSVCKELSEDARRMALQCEGAGSRARSACLRRYAMRVLAAANLD